MRNIRLIASIIVYLFFISFAEDKCREGNYPLLFYTHLYPENIIDVTFFDELFIELYQNLDEIGYCLVMPPYTPPENDTAAANPRILLLAIIDEPCTADTQASEPLLLASISEEAPFDEIKIEELLSRPLVSFTVDADDLYLLGPVIARKITENLRNQYVYHIKIFSTPEQAEIKTSGGLSGITPLEWIRPIGQFSIHASKEGYETVTKDLDLEKPGVHTLYLNLRKRQFYNSNFFYMAAASGIASIVFYSLESHYYQQYLSLGREEYFQNPEKFEQLFNKAKTYEYLTLGSLLFSGVSLGLSFIF